MKYYLIVGEASGDLQASNLMKSLAEIDSDAEFRFFGGDLMQSVGGSLVKHYRELAYMGFVPVLLHLRTILRNMSMCKKDIVEWNPDVLILVDYPGFNLSIAKFIKANTKIPVFYYIAPKIWAWKEYRIKNIRCDVDELFSILPFEVDFFEGKHGYSINYVGNPSVDSVEAFRKVYSLATDGFRAEHGLDDRPIVALLAGSRRQEIKDNLPIMLRMISHFPDRKFVVAGAPGIEAEYYERFLSGLDVDIVYGKTYELLSHSEAALVTSGTATLETALFGVPQVVLYKTPAPALVMFLKKHLLKVPYISLVNLIAGSEVVRELVASLLTDDNVRYELQNILTGGDGRRAQLEGYERMIRRLGSSGASGNAARKMIEILKR